MPGQLLILLCAAIVSAGLVRLIIYKAHHLGLVQAPVARSSHKIPTPTGGGCGIVIGSLLAGLLLPGLDQTSLILLMLGFIIALVGLIDDWRPLSARTRLPVQALVTGLCIWTSHATLILASPASVILTALSFLFLLLAGLWWINLFNFMDGIDGLAGQQAMMMMLSAMLIAALTAPDATGTWIWGMMAALAAATFGFLLFNWPPARIFMGDAGSTFLGFFILVVALSTLVLGWLSLPQWLLLAALFATDASVTLFVRILKGEKASEAHRSHAYQRLSRRLGGARPVTCAALAINALVLLPVAVFLPGDGRDWLIVFLVYIALAGLALGAGAGLADKQAASLQAYRHLARTKRNEGEGT
ncbi:glycosyltransferase family 4 protein [Rhizobium sp. SSA_523]|uniref:MraY family glycosyltransferase n=1 Tax=Rhizobium sp. SSA_523 TaxID=2952477 RepID=UPI0020903822|nr:glycosyltransferase family 4 protein [Rhizobium sp. SSA_523]MCO5734575.1 glycosyltransferase family 4 protein [Rhizobium sp. SSA_523]WKC23355.1 glycosyltransferase family 4 protein [Rhizobium sp. SSA_523]